MFSINLVFVDAETIRNLNKKYRHLDKTATVLSFYYGQAGPAKFPGDEDKSGCLGEVVICLSEAKKQGLTIDQLAVHGLKNILSEVPSAKLK